MAAVLLRLAGLDPLDLNAEPEPPDRQAAEVEQAIGGGKRDAVIGTDAERQPAFQEQPSTKASNLACCWRLFMQGGRVVSFFKVRCMRSWRPFCCGLPGWMRSI